MFKITQTPLHTIGHSLTVACLYLATTATSVNAEPILNGIASYESLGKERFIAALYLDSPTTDVQELFANPQHRRMELRIPERFSGRRHVRTWVEGAAINNPAAVLKANAEAMVAFTQLINVSLKSGDHLVIDSPMGDALTVSLNGVKQGEIEQGELFDVLLRSWVGSVPLSSTFRKEILAGGNIQSNLYARFDNLTPTDERIAFANQLLEPKVEVAQDSEAEQIASNDEDLSSSDFVPSSKINTAEIAGTPRLEAPTLPANPVAEEAEPEPVTVAAVEPISQPAEAAPTPRNDSGPADSPEPITLAALSKAPLDDDDEEALESPLSVESLLAQQLYHSELLATTYKMVKYPRRAVDKNFEGRVTVQVTIDQEGMLLAAETLDDSGHRMLDRAAHKAIEDSSPFPAPPMDLKGESFSFTVPIEFRLE